MVKLTDDLDTYPITVQIDTGQMDNTNCDNNLVFQKVWQSFVSIYDTNRHNSNYIFQPISLRGDVCDQKLASLGTILLTCQYHVRNMCVRGYRFCYFLRFFSYILELFRQCGIFYFIICGAGYIDIILTSIFPCQFSLSHTFLM